MASIRAHLVDAICRVTVKRKLAAATDIIETRKIFDAVPARKQEGVRITPATLGGIAGEWVESTNGQDCGITLLYLHGGGYVGMSPRTHRPITAAFARRGLRVFAADYRLAPEHQFPAAVDDARAAWQALHAMVEGPLCVAGDSAGGGLSLALMLDLRERNLPLPQAAILFSPWTDLTASGASMTANASRDAILPATGMDVLASSILGDTDPRNPLASPVYGDMGGLPPMIFQVGAREILLDDTARVAAKARAAGVSVAVDVVPVVPHVWQLFSGLPESARSFNTCVAFLKQHAVQRIQTAA